MATVQALKVQADNCCVLLTDRLAFWRLALIPEAVFFSNEAHEGKKSHAKTLRRKEKKELGVGRGFCPAAVIGPIRTGLRMSNVSSRRFMISRFSTS